MGVNGRKRVHVKATAWQGRSFLADPPACGFSIGRSKPPAGRRAGRSVRFTYICIPTNAYSTCRARAEHTYLHTMEVYWAGCTQLHPLCISTKESGVYAYCAVDWMDGCVVHAVRERNYVQEATCE